MDRKDFTDNENTCEFCKHKYECPKELIFLSQYGDIIKKKITHCSLFE